MPLLPGPDEWNDERPDVSTKRGAKRQLKPFLVLGLCLMVGWVAYQKFSRAAFDAPSTHSGVPAIIQ